MISGFTGWCLGFPVWLRIIEAYRIWGVEFKVSGLGFQFCVFILEGPELVLQKQMKDGRHNEICVYIWVWGSGFRVSGLRFRAQSLKNEMDNYMAMWM